jgi:hypothetical protein
MARYEHLPLFKDIYRFNLYFFRLSKNFGKDYKYGLGQEVRSLATELLDQIVQANGHLNKRPFLEEAELIIERMKLKLRLLNDLGIMNIKSYNFIFCSLRDISKQVTAWKNWSDKGQE